MKEVSLNFGAIRDSILRMASNEILQENFKKGSLSKFKKALQEVAVLKKQYLVFKNFENCKPFSKENLAERFINQNIKIMKNESWDNLMSENKKVRLDILGDTHVEANSGNEDLFEHVHTLIEASIKPNFTNIQKEQESYDFLLKYLMREEREENKSEEVKENPEFGWDYITKIAVSNFNKRYSHLNEAEKETLAVLLSPHENKKIFLKSIQEENKKTIENLLKESSEDKEKEGILGSFQEKLGKIDELNEEKIDDAILYLMELKEALKDI